MVYIWGSIEFLVGAVLLWGQAVAKCILPGFTGSVVPILLMAVGMLQVVFTFV